MEVTEPHFFIFNELINSVHQQAVFDLLRVVDFVLIKFSDLVIRIFAVHEGIEVCVNVFLDLGAGH